VSDVHKVAESEKDAKEHVWKNKAQRGIPLEKQPLDRKT